MRITNIHTGLELTPRQIKFVYGELTPDDYLDRLSILVDDNIYYVKYLHNYYEFDSIQDVKDFLSIC